MALGRVSAWAGAGRGARCDWPVRPLKCPLRILISFQDDAGPGVGRYEVDSSTQGIP
jgi:hypothetical protein